MRIPSGVVHVTSGQAIVDEDDYRLYIPSSVRSIGEEAFSRVYELEEVAFERGSRLERIEDSAFSMCFDLKKIKIPASCEYIGVSAFDSCKLSELGFESDSRLRKIGARAFWNSKLKSIELPTSLVEIGEDAFANCEALEDVRLSDGLEKIADSTFENCPKLYSINIPGTVTYIGRKAFAGCSDLSAMELPDEVMVTGERFLNGCSGLRSITIPRHARSLESFPLFSCHRAMGFPPIAANERLPEEAVNPMLTHILVSGDNESFCSVDGILYTKDMRALLKYPFGREDESFSIPEGVREIGSEAFALCTHLKRVIIPDSVSSIGFDAFRELHGSINKRCQGPSMTLVASKGSWAEKLAPSGPCQIQKGAKDKYQE